MKFGLALDRSMSICFATLALLVAGNAMASVPPVSCTNLAFPGAPACQDYTGAGWDSETADADCQTPMPGSTGAGDTFVGAYCDATGVVGTCTIDPGAPDEKQLHFYAGEPATLEASCVNYLGGIWTVVTNPSCNHEMVLGPPGSPAAPVCTDYVGEGWEQAAATDNCSALTGGSFQAGPCAKSTIGYCTVGQGSATESDLHFYAGDAASLEYACGAFLRGVWTSTAFAGSCETMMPFGPPPYAPMVSICKQYDGLSYDAATAQADCAAVGGLFAAGEPCAEELELGTCAQSAGTDDEYGIHFYEDNELGWNAIQFRDACVAPFPRGLGGDWAFSADLPMQIINALVSDSAVSVTPNACLTDNCLSTLVANGEAIIFEPADGSATTGLLIYPGGMVEPRAYAVAARMLASYGYLVALVPFPGNLPITDPMRGLGVMMSKPLITSWAIAGHSLGGVTASILAAANPMGKLKGIAFWASYPAPAQNGMPAADLSGSGLKAISINAELDGGFPWAEFEAMKTLMPTATHFVEIRGGNHGQFGYYGDQPGDLPAEISREEQHALFVGATVHMMNRIGVPAELDVIDGIYGAMDDHMDEFCNRAQRETSQFKPNQLKEADITDTFFESRSDFASSKPTFEADGYMIGVTSYQGQTANPTDIFAPPILDGTVWCKLKTQQAIAAEFGLTPLAEEKMCAVMNEKALEWALEELGFGDAALDAYLAMIDMVDDLTVSSGPEYLAGPVTLSDMGDGTFALQGVSLWTPMFMPPGLEAYAGNYYCKVWSVEAAMQFILSHPLF